MPTARCLMILALLSLSTSWTQAATFSCPGGDTACLIAAISASNANGEANTITLGPGIYALPVVADPALLGRLTIIGVITLQGSGANATFLEPVPSLNARRLIWVTGALTLQGVTLRGAQNGGIGVGAGAQLTVHQSRLTAHEATAGLRGQALLNAGGAVLIQQTTIDHNVHDPPVADDRGGAIAQLSGELTIESSALLANGPVDVGGGVYIEQGTVTILNSTIAQNRSGVPAGGGAALTNIFGSVRISHSTIVDNVAVPYGTGGIHNASGTVELDHTILARNQAEVPFWPPNCLGDMTSLGHNLIGDPTGCTITLQPTDRTGDPGLDAFVDDGTPGHGHYPLLATSQAIDVGGACPETDQLGQPRADRCDIGAVEFQPEPVDVVAVRQAVFLNARGQLLVIATSSEAPEAILSLTVPGCLQDVPLGRVGRRYVGLDAVPANCGGLEGQMVTVRSSLGGVASGVIR
jgi:hypothetical protein